MNKESFFDRNKTPIADRAQITGAIIHGLISDPKEFGAAFISAVAVQNKKKEDAAPTIPLVNVKITDKKLNREDAFQEVLDLLREELLPAKSKMPLIHYQSLQNSSKPGDKAQADRVNAGEQSRALIQVMHLIDASDVSQRLTKIGKETREKSLPTYALPELDKEAAANLNALLLAKMNIVKARLAAKNQGQQLSESGVAVDKSMAVAAAPPSIGGERTLG